MDSDLWLARLTTRHDPLATMNRNPDQNSGEGLVRIEGVLTETLGFAGLLGQSGNTALLQPWGRNAAGELVESPLSPVTITNRNPDWAWQTGEFVTTIALNGEQRPLTHSGYNWLMHSRTNPDPLDHTSTNPIGEERFIPRANRWGYFSTGSGVAPQFEPDYTPVATFSSEDGSGDVEFFEINAYVNNTITQVETVASGGNFRTWLSFSGSDARWGLFTANVLTLVWLGEYDGAVSFVRCSAERGASSAGVTTTGAGIIGFRYPAIGICCSQDGRVYIARGDEAPHNSYAFRTTPLAPMRHRVAADFFEVTSSGPDFDSHPDFDAPTRWGLWCAPALLSKPTMQEYAELSVDNLGHTFTGSVVMNALEFSRFAICIAPG